MTDPVIELLDELGLPATRQNYIDVNWSPLPDPWTPDDEAELPEELQDWTQFEVRDGELVAKSDATRDADPWENEPRKGTGPGGGEWTAGGGGAAAVKGGTTVHVHVAKPKSKDPFLAARALKKALSDPADKRPPSARIIAQGPDLEGSSKSPERYQGVGDQEFEGPHAMEDALRTGRVLASGENRRAVEATMKQAGLKLVDPTRAPADVAKVFRLEAYDDTGQGKSGLWYSDTKVMAKGLADAVDMVEKQGFKGLAKELRTNTNVMFASYDRSKGGAYGGDNAPIAAVWGDKATGQQWLVVNTANGIKDDWSPARERGNTVGAQNAQKAYDAGLAKLKPPAETGAPGLPEGWETMGVKEREAAEALALRDAMIHEMGHVLDNLTNQGMRKGLAADVKRITGGDLGIDYGANQWMREHFSDYSATNAAEGAAEAWTMAVTRPKEFPSELKGWRDSALGSAQGAWDE